MYQNRHPSSFIFQLLIAGLFLSTWYLKYIEIGGFSIISISELILISIFFLTFFYRRNIIRLPKKLVLHLILFLIIGILYFMDSFIKGYSISECIGPFRRLFFYPVLGFFIGYKFRNVNYSESFFYNAFKYFIFLLLAISIINIFVGFNPLFDFAIMNRPEAMLLFIPFFYYLKKFYATGKYIWLTFFFGVLIFFSSSRGIYITFILFNIIFVKKLKDIISIKSFIRINLLILVFSSIIIGIYTFSDTIQSNLNRELGQIDDVFEGDYGSWGKKSNNVGIRLFRYQSAFKAGLEKPITGQGIAYKHDFYIGGAYNRLEENNTAHNFILTIWYKTGIIGLLFYTLFLKTIIKQLRWSLIIQLFFISCYIYSFVDVMMASTTSAILFVYFIAGFCYMPIKNIDI